MHVGDGRTDYFHEFEYFGLIPLVNRVYRVHLMQFFLRAGGVSAAWLPSVPYCGGSIVYLCLLIVRLRSLCTVQGGGQQLLLRYLWLRQCRLALRPRLC